MFKIFRRYLESFKEYIVLILLLLFSLLILSFNQNNQLKKIRAFAFGNIAVINSVVSSFGELLTLKKEVKKLEKLNAELMLKINKLREYGIENKELKRLIELKDTTKFPVLPVTIVSKIIPSLPGYYIINAGAADSVEQGMPVINDKGLIGIITETTDNFSFVKTLLSHDSRIAVRDERSGVDGILGFENNMLLIKNVPTTYDFRIGDRIVTSVVSTIVPPSIPIGIVAQKQTSIAGLLTNIEVYPFVDFQKVRNCAVLKIVNSKELENLELNLLRK